MEIDVKKTTLIISFLLIVVPAQSQKTLYVAKSKGRVLFDKGCDEFRMGNYTLADSFFTEASMDYDNRDVYFNRAVSRLYLKDTIGFCNDMNILTFYFVDDEASRLSDSICCTSVDTVYYDRKLNQASKEKFRYYEVIKKLKYEKLTLGLIHEQKSYFSSDYVHNPISLELLGYSTMPKDIAATYKILNGTKYYVLTRTPPRPFRFYDIEQIKEKSSTYFREKYQKLKETNKIDGALLIYFAITIDTDGSISFHEIEGTNHNISLESVRDELTRDLKDMVHQYPPAKPAKLFHKKVGFIAMDHISI